MEGVSQSEYARSKGLSKQYISKLVTQGKLPLNDKKKIDPAIADAALAQIADPARALGEAPADDDLDEPEAPKGPSYNHARIHREIFQGKLAELQYEEASGKLVAREEVEREAFTQARMTRDRLLSLPQEIAGDLLKIEGESAMVLFLRNKIRDALIEIATDVSAGI